MAVTKKCALLACSASSILALPSLAADANLVSVSGMGYVESDQRIEVQYAKVVLNQSIGTDWLIKLDYGIDAITGGTPTWDTVSGASGSTASDAVSGATPCIVNEGSYYDECRNTRDDMPTTGILGDGQFDEQDFVYRNSVIDDIRQSAGAIVTWRDPARNEYTSSLNYSQEQDFKSWSASGEHLHFLDKLKNRSLSVGASAQYNQAYHFREDHWKSFKTGNAQLGWTEILSAKTLVQSNLYYTREQGSLDNPYLTVIRRINVKNDDSSTPYFKYYLAEDRRPKVRNSGGVVLNMAHRLLDNTTVGINYRWYQDDWQVQSNTLNIRVPVDIGKQVRFTPSLRAYQQSAASFYKGHQDQDRVFAETGFASSDDRLSNFYGMTYQLMISSQEASAWRWQVSGAFEQQSYGLEMAWVTTGISYAY